MKIAFFTDDYLPYVHGVTRSIQNYRQALEDLGHEVYIVAPKPKQKGWEDDDDHVIRLPSVNSYVFDNRPVSLLYPGIARKLYGKFDIVHSQTQFYLGVIAGMVAKHDHIPHFTTVHTLYTELLDDYPMATTAGLIAVSIGFPFVYKTKPILPFDSRSEILELSRADAAEIKKKQGWRLMAALINKDDACIAPSEHLARTLRENGATVPIHVLPNGIALESYRAADTADSPITKAKGDKFIICVARISGEKRQRVLVEMMPLIADDSAKLVLVGDGPERENLEALAQELGVADRVIFTGLHSATEVAAMLAQSDIFVLPSYRFDNQPMSILEAIASGLPVVYCDDNLTEGLTTDNSLLVDGIEAADFARGLEELLHDPKRLKAMSKASRQLATHFDRDDLVKKLIEHYECAIANCRLLNHKLKSDS